MLIFLILLNYKFDKGKILQGEKLRNVLDLVKWGQEYFQKKGIESSRLTIELMLSKILNCSRVDLYLRFELPLTDNQLETLRNYVIRRTHNEPLQYILGEAPFYGTFFNSDHRALIPRPETELLVNEAINFLKTFQKPKILEVGTGSGCISIILAMNFPDSEITSIDNSEKALELAVENSEKFNTKNINFFKLNFLEEKIYEDKFDLIISNPPYIPKEKMKLLDSSILNFEPIDSLTDEADGLTFYRKFAQYSNYLSMDGTMMLEIDGRNTPELLELFRNSGFETTIIKDLANMDRVIKLVNRND